MPPLLVSFFFLILTATTAAVMFVLLKQGNHIMNSYKRKEGRKEGTRFTPLRDIQRKQKCTALADLKLHVLCAVSAISTTWPNFLETINST